MKRLIGIRHRVKKTADGEARPTELFVQNDDGSTGSLELATETDELDWVMGRFPAEHRAVQPDDDLAKFKKHHVKWRPLKDDETPENLPRHLLKKEKKVWFIASKVPSAYEGLRDGDTVVMILGGSGDALASAISRRGEAVNAKAFRVPASFVKMSRPNPDDKANDAAFLTQLFKEHPDRFYQVLLRDRKIIHARERYRARMEAMRDRIKCEQRIFASTVGAIFTEPEGEFPEGTVEDLYEDRKEKNPGLQSQLTEEAARKSELETALEELPVYTEILSEVEGLGPSISARIIAAVQDIRRFENIAKFKAFCGVHVLKDGRFPRQRHGEVANWHPDPRQAFFLVGDQFNRRPGTVWGAKLLANKQGLRSRHPEVVVNDEGKKKYTDGHILKMALWRTRTRFAEWLFRQWKALEVRETQNP